MIDTFITYMLSVSLCLFITVQYTQTLNQSCSIPLLEPTSTKQYGLSFALNVLTWAVDGIWTHSWPITSKTPKPIASHLGSHQEADTHTRCIYYSQRWKLSNDVHASKNHECVIHMVHICRYSLTPTTDGRRTF